LKSDCGTAVFGRLAGAHREELKDKQLLPLRMELRSYVQLDQE
jgi:hypothetical protein